VRHSQAEEPAWVEVGVGERVGGDLPAGQLPGEAAAAPAHPGVEDDAAEQVDIEDVTGPAARETQARGQLMQRLRVLDEWRRCAAV
jgi:hypothetical protein